MSSKKRERKRRGTTARGIVEMNSIPLNGGQIHIHIST